MILGGILIRAAVQPCTTNGTYLNVDGELEISGVAAQLAQQLDQRLHPAL